MTSTEPGGPGLASALITRYDELRQRLVELHCAAVPDMAAIDQVMHQLDDTHAAFKALHATGQDHQRY